MDNIKLKPIKGFKAFSKAFGAGRKFHEKNLLASIVFGNPKDVESDDNAMGEDRYLYFGVSIGKKTARRAVVRNRIKRLMRESLRKEACNMGAILPVSIIMIWKHAPLKRTLIGLSDVHSELKAVLNRANNYFKSNQQGGL